MSPSVPAGCVQARIRQHVGMDPDALARRVAAIASRSGKTPRSINRILAYPADKPMAIALADELLIAAGGMLSIDCPEDA